MHKIIFEYGDFRLTLADLLGATIVLVIALMIFAIAILTEK